jgi:hypothetical protein
VKFPRFAVWVYLAGMIPLGLFYEQVKIATGGTWRFVLVAIAYLLALRLLAEIIEYAAKRARKPSEPPRSDA